MCRVNRGEVWWVRFSAHAQGGEVRKERPAIIVSCDASNRHLNRVQVVPLTSRVGRLYPSESHVKVRGRIHKAMADQIATVGRERTANRVTRLSPAEMDGVDRAIRTQLGL